MMFWWSLEALSLIKIFPPSNKLASLRFFLRGPLPGQSLTTLRIISRKRAFKAPPVRTGIWSLASGPSSLEIRDWRFGARRFDSALLQPDAGRPSKAPRNPKGTFSSKIAMKKLISILWLLFGLKVLVLASQTQAPGDPAGQFILHAKESFFSGSLEFKIAFLDVELGKGKKTNSLSKALDNRNTNLEKAKKLFELAKEYLKEKPSASEALKQLYVQWISSMDSLPPHFTSEGYRQ